MRSIVSNCSIFILLSLRFRRLAYTKITSKLALKKHCDLYNNLKLKDLNAWEI